MLPETVRGGFVSSASFEEPRYIPASAWIGHGPFAFWLVENLKPSVLVELGTYLGYSYFCFCQQVAKQGLATQCTAIDLWGGDEHSGFYGEEIFNTVKRINDQNYGAFSRLMRSTFVEAAGSFEDGSIDLLHIDGRHRYEDVKEDFETWLPKLSDRAVVLFHDTQVEKDDFGVFRYWPEVTAAYPNFEFTHEHGLGVLGVGKNLPPSLKALFNASKAQRAAIKRFYQSLGGTLPRKNLTWMKALSLWIRRALHAPSRPPH